MPVLLMPVSGELPFPDQLDRKDEASFARVWHAQMPQIAHSLHGPAGADGFDWTGRAAFPSAFRWCPARFREDLCLPRAKRSRPAERRRRRSIPSAELDA